MQILLSSDSQKMGLSDVQDWLEFNQIEFQNIQLWDAQECAYYFPQDVENSILICNYDILKNITEVPSIRERQIDALKKFTRQGNQAWFVTIDDSDFLLRTLMSDLVRYLDEIVPNSSMVFFIEGEPTNKCYLHFLQNIQLRVLKTAHTNRGLPRCQAPSNIKVSARYDFLLTMLRKKARPHRDVLWNELKQRKGLLDRGLASFKRQFDEGYLGKLPTQHDWFDGHASMDLYLDCWLEVVPETCYKGIYRFTEKTQKPIMTRTPFLMVSTAGYLDWLRRHGFQTFDSLIDEKYDLHYRVEDRVRHMVDVLEDIVKNGSQDFYKSSRDILDHNFSRLCEIAGAWKWQFDQDMWQALDSFNSQKTKRI